MRCEIHLSVNDIESWIGHKIKEFESMDDFFPVNQVHYFIDYKDEPVFELFFRPDSILITTEEEIVGKVSGEYFDREDYEYIKNLFKRVSKR